MAKQIEVSKYTVPRVYADLFHSNEPFGSTSTPEADREAASVAGAWKIEPSIPPTPRGGWATGRNPGPREERSFRVGARKTNVAPLRRPSGERIRRAPKRTPGSAFFGRAPSGLRWLRARSGPRVPAPRHFPVRV
ncbi:hypothetical protein ISCGN_006634 [Ixodes scapularis]